MAATFLLAAALAFTCDAPTHHDGDAIRCAGDERSMRMHAIDAPEMPGSCRPGRACTPGDPYAARDYLRSLTRGRLVRCEEKDIDAYGRRVVRCTADGEDLGCAMVLAGHAVERYGRLRCNGPSLLPQGGAAETSPQAAPLARWTAAVGAATAGQARDGGAFWWPVAAVLLALYNCLGAYVMQRRLMAARALTQGRGPRFWTSARETQPATGSAGMTALAISGAAPGMVLAALVMGQKIEDNRFYIAIVVCAGVQIGIVAGLLLAS